MITSKILQVLNKPRLILLFFLHKIDPLIKNEILFIKLKYWILVGKKLNMDDPRTFCEKIQWLKINNRCPSQVEIVDKYLVKNIVKKKIGEEYVIPTIGIWNTPDAIDWETLPNQFVLKTTHAGGSFGVVVCRDKKTFDKKSAIKKLTKSLLTDSFKYTKEWPYKNVQRRIIAEKYMEDKNASGDLIDYKFFCFNGEPKFCQVIRNRSEKETIDFYDMNWEHQEFVGLTPGLQNGKCQVDKPGKLNDMIDISRKLSVGIPFIRVDLYYIEDKVYFGELTFFPASGFGEFFPNEWNRKLGDLILL